MGTECKIPIDVPTVYGKWCVRREARAIVKQHVAMLDALSIAGVRYAELQLAYVQDKYSA